MTLWTILVDLNNDLQLLWEVETFYGGWILKQASNTPWKPHCDHVKKIYFEIVHPPLALRLCMGSNIHLYSTVCSENMTSVLEDIIIADSPHQHNFYGFWIVILWLKMVCVVLRSLTLYCFGEFDFLGRGLKKGYGKNPGHRRQSPWLLENSVANPLSHPSWMVFKFFLTELTVNASLIPNPTIWEMSAHNKIWFINIPEIFTKSVSSHIITEQKILLP